MSQIISKFPAMMLGFIGENDLKILEYDEDIVVFESANDIEQPFDLTSVSYTHLTLPTIA